MNATLKSVLFWIYIALAALVIVFYAISGPLLIVAGDGWLGVLAIVLALTFVFVAYRDIRDRRKAEARTERTAYLHPFDTGNELRGYTRLSAASGETLEVQDSSYSAEPRAWIFVAERGFQINTDQALELAAALFAFASQAERVER